MESWVWHGVASALIGSRQLLLLTPSSDPFARSRKQTAGLGPIHLTLIPWPILNVSPSLTTVSVPGDCLDPPYALTPECAASWRCRVSIWLRPSVLGY